MDFIQGVVKKQKTCRHLRGYFKNAFEVVEGVFPEKEISEEAVFHIRVKFLGELKGNFPYFTHLIGQTDFVIHYVVLFLRK